jgi:hypothetical protein
MMESTIPALVKVRVSELHLHSSIGKQYRDELEELFFFNPRQCVVRDKVIQHVAQYGSPRIVTRGETITLELGHVEHAQTLFLMAGSGRAQLLGVVIYVREHSALKVIHLVFKSACTCTWRSSCELLEFVVESLKRIARCVTGVGRVEFCVGPRTSVFRV